MCRYVSIGIASFQVECLKMRLTLLWVDLAFVGEFISARL